MSVERVLQQRSNNQCELCGSSEKLGVYNVPSSPKDGDEAAILVCNTCNSQIENPDHVSYFLRGGSNRLSRFLSLIVRITLT